jgi:hypothetical protein
MYVRMPEENLRTLQAADKKRLVHSILDVSGLSRSHMTHMKNIKEFLGLVPKIMPDITATISVINAPWIFAMIFKVTARFPCAPLPHATPLRNCFCLPAPPQGHFAHPSERCSAKDQGTQRRQVRGKACLFRRDRPVPRVLLRQ